MRDAIHRTAHFKCQAMANGYFWFQDVFIVHGHEHHLREDVAGCYENCLRRIILDQQASSSLTVIENWSDWSTGASQLLSYAR